MCVPDLGPLACRQEVDTFGATGKDVNSLAHPYCRAAPRQGGGEGGCALGRPSIVLLHQRQPQGADLVCCVLCLKQIPSRKNSLIVSQSSAGSSKTKVLVNAPPMVKKDRRSSSSRFNASNNRELQKLPPLKGNTVPSVWATGSWQLHALTMIPEGYDSHILRS